MGDQYETPFTYEALKKLEAAIALGARKVEFSDRKVEFDSLEKMEARARLIRRRLGIGGNIADETIIPRFSKGL